MQSAEHFQIARQFLVENSSLPVNVWREIEYYGQQSERETKVRLFVTYVVGGVMSLAALFGSLNTMYAAVNARSVEIATLRALGFQGASVVVSFLLEALLLSLLGAMAGSLLAWGLFDGNLLSTRAASRQLIFELQVTAQMFFVAVLCGCLIGLVGGLFAATRSVRQHIATVLQEY